MNGAAYSLLVTCQQKETVQLQERHHRPMKCYLCTAQLLFFVVLLKSQADEDSSLLKGIQGKIPNLSYWLEVQFCILKRIWKWSGALKINLAPLLPLWEENIAQEKLTPSDWQASYQHKCKHSSALVTEQECVSASWDTGFFLLSSMFMIPCWHSLEFGLILYDGTKVS